jgi:predicted ATPase
VSGADEDLAQIRNGLAAFQATGANIGYSVRLAFLAELYVRARRIDEGLRAVDEALAHIERHDERNHEAELHRLRGELLVGQAPPDEEHAAACFHTAIEIARRQQAKLLELRATTSLALLWHRQGRGDHVRQMLADVYGWFTEGFDTPDLKNARALLAELE